MKHIGLLASVIRQTEVGLGVACRKGAPALDRPDIEAPSAAAWWDGDASQSSQRVGTANDVWQATYRVAIYAQDEPDLLAFVDAWQTMMRSWTEETVDNKQFRVTTGQIQRLADALEMDSDDVRRYATVCDVGFLYQL